MNLVFAFAGLFLGLLYGFGDGVPYYLALSFLAASALCLSFIGRRWRFFLACLATGALLGLLPHGASLGEGEKVLFVFRCGDNYFLGTDGWCRYYVSYAGHDLEFGDLIRATGTCKALRLTSYESRFDFASYLSSWGVSQEFAIQRKTLSFLLRCPLRMRAYENWCLRSFDEGSRALILAALSNRKDSENLLLQKASALNLAYLLSSSGLIAGIVLRGVEKMMKWKIKERWAEGVTLALNGVMIVLSPYKIGLYRLFLTKSITLLDAKFKWGLKSHSRTSLAGIALLLIEPHLAYQSGFWLGFGASLLSFFGNALVKRANVKYRFLPRFALFHLFLLPVEIGGSGGFHLFSSLFAYLLIPFVVFYDAVGVLSLLCIPLALPSKGVTSLFSCILDFLAKLDLKIPLSSLPRWCVLLYYACFFLALLLMELGCRRKSGMLSLSFLSCFALSYLPIGNLCSQAVYFVNVGQGDCILIRDGVSAVMIDTGGVSSFDIAEEVLIPFLRKERIYRIDCLIATHDDFDHIGGKDFLLQNYPVMDFKEGADAFPLTVQGLTFQNINVFDWEEENDGSLVLTLSFMGKDWVFMGDASVETEKRILDEGKRIPCDVLKVGHHGSKTSTSEEWLDALTPEEAVISCGAKKKYGHPDEEILARLEERGVAIRRTDLEGTIRYARFKAPWV